MPRSRLHAFLAVVAAAATLAACQQTDADGEGEADASAAAEAGVVQVTAKDFEFQAPEEIPSGWTTIRFANTGEEEHFVLLWHLPEDRTFRDYRTEIVDTFTKVWSRYASGQLDRAETEEALGAELPEWFFTGVQPRGGAALTEPGDTSQVTVQLEPGTYVMECYVKTPQGTWHTERGMFRELTVTEASAGASPPEADAELTLSNYQLEAPGDLPAGTHTLAVHVRDNPEGFMPHDVNLFRLEGDAGTEEIVAWMDWMDLDQFRTPAPGHSLGGVEHMTAGNTGYLTVTLEPGRYAWVSEGYGHRGMVEEFTVQ